ncbi:uncharacterized protein [Anabrus simplex]|uniref:uncharacterized protein n=1 Tax=Anabrus simplex TaxID=316456 RepID=UPI0035A32239
MSLEQLIEEVRKYPCLWNKTLQEYRNQNMRDKAWDMISTELDKPVEYLKAEWKKLQDSHRQAMLRRKTRSGQSANKMKPWKYEALMSFLLSELIPRLTESNSDSAEGTQERESVEGLVIGGENEDEEEVRRGSVFQNRRGSSKCRKRIDNERDVDKVITFLQDKQVNKSKPGELDYFFASACESTEHLPRRLQLKVKHEVMQTILNAEMKCLDNELSNTSLTPSTSFRRTPSPPVSHSSLTVRAHENANQSSGSAGREKNFPLMTM